MNALHVWLRRAVWLIIGIAGFWVAYQFGSGYSRCRDLGSEKGLCIFTAVSGAYDAVAVMVITTVFKILSFLLP
ncbi:hypothetical protein [Bradyrhizobium sp.]